MPMGDWKQWAKERPAWKNKLHAFNFFLSIFVVAKQLLFAVIRNDFITFKTEVTSNCNDTITGFFYQ
jgi:hypothetical protein